MSFRELFFSKMCLIYMTHKIGPHIDLENLEERRSKEENFSPINNSLNLNHAKEILEWIIILCEIILIIKSFI